MDAWVSGKIGGLALVALVALLILRQIRPEWGTFIRVAVAAVAGGVIVGMVAEVLSFVGTLTDAGRVWDGETQDILVKALGVAFLSEAAASICRDSGEGALAGWVEMAGRVEILLLSFPLIRTVMDTVAELLGGR